METPESLMKEAEHITPPTYGTTFSDEELIEVDMLPKAERPARIAWMKHYKTRGPIKDKLTRLSAQRNFESGYRACEEVKNGN